MSRMLRGQATLQRIIGKSSIPKRPGNAQQNNKATAASNPPAASDPPPKEELKPATGEPEQRDDSAQQELPPGHVSCPVCGRTLKGDDAHINLHLDKCLAKKAFSRGNSQTTLSQFVRPAEERHQSKRARLEPSCSAPEPNATAALGPSPHGSPKRKGAQAASGLLEASRTRSGRIISPVKPGTQLNFPPGNPPPDSPAATLETPFKASSQEQVIEGRGGPKTAEEVVPNSGRGGHAGTSDSLETPRPGVMRLQTQAVGRKWNSSGVAAVGQVAEIRHEADNPRDKNALLLVAGPPGGVLGYLPRLIAHHLGPLVRQGLLGSKASVLKLSTNDKAPISVDLELWPKLADGDPQMTELQQKLLKAKAAAESVGSGAMQRSGSGKGEILRSNFLLLLDAVMEQDSHLFSEQEQSVFDTYRELPDEAQMLFLRLFLRAGPWFKLTGMAYSECPDVVGTAAVLDGAALALDLAKANGNDRKAAVKCLTSLELQTVLAALQLLPAKQKGKSLSRKQLVNLMHHSLDSPSKGDQVVGAMHKMLGPCTRLREPACQAVLRAQRLFFLNESQSLSNFLVMDLGILQYPEYQVHRTRSVFPDRAALLAYEQALKQAAALDTELEREDRQDLGEAHALLAPALAAIDAGAHKLGADPATDFLMRFSAAWVYTSMATLAVSMLEKEKRYTDACDLIRKLLGGQCCPARRGEWWSRLTINLSTHLKREEEALETAEAALADEWVKHGDRLDLQRRALRLSQPPRRWKVYPWATSARREAKEVRIEAQPLPNVLGIKSKFPHPCGEGECSVEELALACYADQEHGGWLGVHAEGGIWSTLFGLLMWDAIFMAVPDVFRNQFQTAPLDLPTPAFFPARQQALGPCLKRIRSGAAPEMLRSRWSSSYKTMCNGVNWDRHDVDDLAAIAECIGGPGLAGVCHLLAEDRSGWQGGMPDLLLWHPERRAAKLSEVKGPRDHLSMQQRAWLNALSAAGIDVEVLKVVEPVAGKKLRGRWR